MKTQKILVYLSFISSFCFGQETLRSYSRKYEGTQLVRKHDTLSNLNVESYSITKPRKLLFIKLGREKLIVNDMVISNDKIILKGKSKFIKSIDAAKTVRFSRIKIRDNRIFKYKECSLRKSGIIIEYDLDGRQLKKKKLDKHSVTLEYKRE